MTGGLIQLVAKGIEDIFLTYEPQITFFKIVYRRHTNFSVEPIKQFFIGDTPDFGKKSTCLISKNGDLMSKTTVVITLPKINMITSKDKIDPITKVAWVRKIGYALIKSIEIEIGGTVIDRHYCDWLNIWAELTTNKTEQYDKMIGNVEELYGYTNGKDEYILYVPLNFWFCRSYGLSLPLISLQYSDVKINLELNDLDSCFLITPTNYIEIENELVNFKPFEYIEQNVNGTIASGMFNYYDPLTKRLYYSRISRNKFQSYQVPTNLSPSKRQQLIYQTENSKYWIKSLLNGSFASPKFNSNPQVHSYNKLKNISLQECYLLVDYIFLDTEERTKFTHNRHDYLIEQLNYIGEKTLVGSYSKVKFDSVQPSKLMVWVAQYSYLLEKYNNDLFNYTDNYKYSQTLYPRKKNLTSEDPQEIYELVNDNYLIKTNKQTGKSLVKKETIGFNGQERLSNRDYNYFNYSQGYQYFTNGPSEGINVYSYSLSPEQTNPTGTANLGQLDNINLNISLVTNISSTNTVKLRGYSLENNIFRIISGISGLVFAR